MHPLIIQILIKVSRHNTQRENRSVKVQRPISTIAGCSSLRGKVCSGLDRSDSILVSNGRGPAWTLATPPVTCAQMKSGALGSSNRYLSLTPSHRVTAPLGVSPPPLQPQRSNACLFKMTHASNAAWKEKTFVIKLSLRLSSHVLPSWPKNKTLASVEYHLGLVVVCGFSKCSPQNALPDAVVRLCSHIEPSLSRWQAFYFDIYRGKNKLQFLRFLHTCLHHNVSSKN